MLSSESSGLYDDPRLLLVGAVNDPLCLLEDDDVENTLLEEFIQDDDEYDDRSSVEDGIWMIWEECSVFECEGMAQPTSTKAACSKIWRARRQFQVIIGPICLIMND
jgi:hypothetical protein